MSCFIGGKWKRKWERFAKFPVGGEWTGKIHTVVIRFTSDFKWTGSGCVPPESNGTPILEWRGFTCLICYAFVAQDIGMTRLNVLLPRDKIKRQKIINVRCISELASANALPAG